MLFSRPYDWSLARIARRLGVDVGTVRRWCADLRDSDPHARLYDRAAILADAAPPNNMSRAALIEKYGCSPRFLSDLLTGKLKP